MNQSSQPTPQPVVKRQSSGNLAAFLLLTISAGINIYCSFNITLNNAANLVDTSSGLLIGLARLLFAEFFALFLVIIFCAGHYVNFILSAINLAVRNRIMQIIMFILAVLSTLITIYWMGCMNEYWGLWFWVCLIANLAPSVFLFINLLTK